MVRSQSLALELNHDLDESALSVEFKVRKKKVLLYLMVLGSYVSYKMRHAIRNCDRIVGLWSPRI